MRGPLASAEVQSAIHVGEKQTFCYLTSGWAHFLIQNNLKLEDTILFRKTFGANFKVSKT